MTDKKPTICPHCGRETLEEPLGYITLCGNRVDALPPEHWKDRMLIASACAKRAKLNNGASNGELRTES